MKAILGTCSHAERQTCLFSATMPKWVRTEAPKYMLNTPEMIDLVGDAAVKVTLTPNPNPDPNPNPHPSQTPTPTLTLTLTLTLALTLTRPRRTCGTWPSLLSTLSVR